MSDGMKSWVWERDGDLNPTLALMTLFGLLGAWLNVVGTQAIMKDPRVILLVLPILCLFDLLMVVVFAVGWYKLSRAKVLANSRVLAAGARAIGDLTRGFDRDERDDDQRTESH